MFSSEREQLHQEHEVLVYYDFIGYLDPSHEFFSSNLRVRVYKLVASNDSHREPSVMMLHLFLSEFPLDK